MAVIARKGGTLLSETDIVQGEFHGREFRAQLQGGLFIDRSYLAGKRMYQIMVMLRSMDGSEKEIALKILDSFKILTPAEVEAITKEKIAAAFPEPLPQTPVAPRAGSDASDEGIHGNVKIVATESQDLSGTWAVGSRKPNSNNYYNEQGNLTKSESYDWKGNLFELTVYGYIDGARVSNFKTIAHEYDPPPIMISAAPSTEKAKPKYDGRYIYKFVYRYDSQKRLVEETLLNNGGELWIRYVYSYKGNRKEEFAYSKDGSLNQHYLYTLDAQGNPTEEIVFDVNDGSIKAKDSYSYELDGKGNWIKRTESNWASKTGRYEPYSVYYRTISYYQ